MDNVTDQMILFFSFELLIPLISIVFFKLKTANTKIQFPYPSFSFLVFLQLNQTRVTCQDKILLTHLGKLLPLISLEPETLGVSLLKFYLERTMLEL